MEVEITSTCEGCGLEIVEEKPEIRTEEHKFVDLTEGGKVCNCCWYLVNDGTFTDTTEYIAKEKSYAYTNVRKDGTPYGVQYVNGNKSSIRTIFAGDKITIIGKLNGCCLVEYPISGGASARSSGGYWYGFVKESVLDEKEIKQENPSEGTSNIQQYVQAMYDAVLALDESELKAKQIFENEYYLAQYFCDYWSKEYGWYDQLQRNGLSGKGIIFNNIERLFNTEAYLFDLEYELLQTAISEIPPSFDNNNTLHDTKINTQDDVNNIVEVIFEFVDTAGEIYGEDFSKLGDECYKVISSRISKISEVFDEGLNWKCVSNGMIDQLAKNARGTVISAVFEAVRAYNAYTNFRIAAELEYFEVLRDIFMGDENIIKVIDELEVDYLNKVTAFSNCLFDFVLYQTGEETASYIVALVLPEIVVIAKATDVILKAIGTVSGLTKNVNSKELLALYGWILYDTRYSYISKLMSYNGSYHDACVIESYYQVWRGMQIYYNGIVIDYLESSDEYDYRIVGQLEDEIEQLKKQDISNWTFNECGFLQEIPDTSSLSDNYYMNILLYGYPFKKANNYDGVIENWDKMTTYQKMESNEIITNLVEFNKYDVSRLYVMEMITKDSYGNIQDTSFSITNNHMMTDSYLYVNEIGMGLHFTRWYVPHTAGTRYSPFYVTCYTVLDNRQVLNLLTGNTPMRTEWLSVNSERWDVFWICTSFEYSTYVNKYIEYDINVEEYHKGLNILLGERACSNIQFDLRPEDILTSMFGLGNMWGNIYPNYGRYGGYVKRFGKGKVVDTSNLTLIVYS